MTSAGTTTTVGVDSRKLQIKKTLQQAVCVMCRNSVMYNSTLSIEAVIGITIDDGADSLIISINEVFQRSDVENEWLQSERKPTVTSDAQLDTYGRCADVVAAGGGKAHSTVNRKPRRRRPPKVENETSFRLGQCAPSEPLSGAPVAGAEHEYFRGNAGNPVNGSSSSMYDAGYNDKDDCIEIKSEDEQYEMDVKFSADGSAAVPAGSCGNFSASSRSRSAYNTDQPQYYLDESSYGEVDAGVDMQYADDEKYHVADFSQSYAQSQTISRAGATANLRGKKSQFRSKQASLQQRYRRSLAAVGSYGSLAKKQKVRSRSVGRNFSNPYNRASVRGNASVDWQQTEADDTCDQNFVGDTTEPPSEVTVTYSTTYTCNICGAQMSRLDSFRRHKRSHLSRTAARCDICGKIYSRNDSMLAHRRRCAGALE